MDNKCGDCGLFKKLSVGVFGKCRRYPPGLVPNFGQPVMRYDYPLLSETEDACGEWRLAEPKLKFQKFGEMTDSTTDQGAATQEALIKLTGKVVCYDVSCPHYGTPHGHDPQDLQDTVPLPAVAQAADLTPDRMKDLYPRLREQPIRPTAEPPKHAGMRYDLSEKFLAQAKETYGPMWEGVDAIGQAAAAFPKAVNEVLRLRDKLPAALYVVETWPRPAAMSLREWEETKRTLSIRLRNILTGGTTE